MLAKASINRLYYNFKSTENKIKTNRISPGGVMVSTEVCGTLSLSSTLSPGTKK